MVAAVPEGVYTMAAKKSILLANGPKYRAARKKMRSGFLDELVNITHLSRKYLGLMLRNAGRKVTTANGTQVVGDPACSLVSRRGRKKRYDREVLSYLLFLWQLSRYVSAPHLVHFIRINHARLFAHPKLRKASAEIKAKLLTISPATTDRLLAPLRRDLLAKRRYKPNPFSSWIKKRIPVESYHDKPKDQLGYLEIDLVSHGGQSPCGEFAYTLVVTEITTGWIELRVLRNKAHVWVLWAMKSIFRSLPFEPTAIHSDNGSEFINQALAKFAEERKLPFTRSRVYKKNDSPYVESKNWTLVRSYSGYRRYDSKAENRALVRLDRLIALKHNLFMPSMKLIAKKRVGPRISKRYDIGTPLRRLLATPSLAKHWRKKLERLLMETDLLQLIDDLTRAEHKLDVAYKSKYARNASASEAA